MTEKTTPGNPVSVHQLATHTMAAANSLPQKALTDSGTMLDLAARRLALAAGEGGHGITPVEDAAGYALATLHRARQTLARTDTELQAYLTDIGAQPDHTAGATALALAGVNILPATGNTRFNRPVVMEAFGRLIEGMPERVTFKDYRHACTAFDTQIGRAVGPHSGAEYYAFRYYSVEMLPKILPHVQRHHFRVNYGDGSMNAQNDEWQRTLPAAVHGIPIEEIIGFAGRTLEDMTGHTQDAVDRIQVEGNCTSVSWQCMKALVNAFPSLRNHLAGRQFETPMRRLIPGERGYPGLTTVSYNHVIYGIDYTDDSGRGMVLSADCTIAQIDRTQQYDIEIAAVPKEDFATYVRLRYRTYPDIPVQLTATPKPSI